MFDKRDDENPKDFKNSLITFSICVCWVDMYGNVIGLHIMRKHLDYWNSEK